MKKVLYSLTIVFCLVINVLCIETNEKVDSFVDFMKKDSVSFSSAYFEGLYTNKQLANVNLEFLRASDRLLASDKIHKSVWLFKYALFLLLLWFNEKAGTALHEIGHGLRARSYGIDFMLIQDYYNDFYKNENFFNFLINNLFNTGRAACATNPYEIANLEKYFQEQGEINNFYNFAIIFSAGGINNNIYLAEKIAEDIHFKNSLQRHLPYLEYVFNLLYGAIYDKIAKQPGDDPYNIIHDFNLKGRDDFKKNTIFTAGIKSLFLSATTYSSLYSLLTNKPMVKPLGFRLPDVFSYITTKGMSYKVVSGYELNEALNLIFGFESVFGKEAATEINLGLNHQTMIANFPMSYKGIITFGQGLDLEASAQSPILKYFDVGLGCEIYSVTSLMGQRHALTNMKEGSGYSRTLFAFIQYRY
jgi:hypothetical protein